MGGRCASDGEVHPDVEALRPVLGRELLVALEAHIGLLTDEGEEEPIAGPRRHLRLEAAQCGAAAVSQPIPL